MYENLGIAKYIVSKKVENLIINESVGYNPTIEFITMIKESDLLQKEYKIFSNIENKTIKKRTKSFLEETLKTLNNNTILEYVDTHKNLNKFVDDHIALVPQDKIELYENVQTLIKESILNENKNLIDYHNSYDYVIEYLKKDKSLNENDISTEEINIQESLVKFKEKFEKLLSEDDMNLVYKLAYNTKEENNKLFESLQTEVISLLENIDKNGIEDKIYMSIDKVKKLNSDNIYESIITLENFKKGLI